MSDSAKNDGKLGGVGSPPKPARHAQANNARAERELPAPLSYRVMDVVRLTGLKRTTVYAAIRSGALIAQKYRGCTIVRHEYIETFLRNLPRTTVARPRRSRDTQS
jgi:hypothetical protein